LLMDNAEEKSRELLLTGTLEEYRMLRAEIKQRQLNMITLITATVAANGVFLKLGFDLSASSPSALIIVALFFLLIIPSINLILLLVLLFEVAQMMQFGNFVLYHEAKLKGIYSSIHGNLDGHVESCIHEVEDRFGLDESIIPINQPLAWEQWLRAMKRKTSLLRVLANLYQTRLAGHLEALYLYRIAIFVFFALLASVIGLYLCWAISIWTRVALTAIPYVLFLTPSAFLTLALSKSSTSK
jgi:hypothetical protein